MVKSSPARSKRIQINSGAGLDLASLEDFCVSMRESGAGDGTLIYTRASWRSVALKLWAEVAPGG